MEILKILLYVIIGPLIISRILMELFTNKAYQAVGDNWMLILLVILGGFVYLAQQEDTPNVTVRKRRRN